MKDYYFLSFFLLLLVSGLSANPHLLNNRGEFLKSDSEPESTRVLGFNSSILNMLYSIDVNVKGETPVNSAMADCTEPEYTISEQCNSEEQYFTVTIDVDDLGSASTLLISDDQGSTVQTLTESGSVDFGPYPYDVDITITLADEDDPDCSVSEVVNSSGCPPPACAEADPFCSGEDYEFPNETQVDQAPEGPDYGCFGSQPNPVWYFLQIDDPGVLEIVIDQQDPNGTGLDVDFVMWGPFDSVEDGCAALMDGVEPLQFGYSADATETIGIGTQGGSVLGNCDGTSTPDPAETGQIYIIMITNYSGQEGSISLDQTDGDGTTNCDIVDPNQYFGCEGEELELQTVNPDQVAYVWSKYNSETDEYEPIEGEDGPTLTVTEGGEYKLESYDEEGSLSEEEFTVVFSPKPELGNLDTEMSLCDVDSLELDARPTNSGEFGHMNYQWSQDGNDFSTDSIITVGSPGTYTVSVTGTIIDSEGLEVDESCATTMTIEVTEANFTVDLGGDQTLCDQDSYELTAELEGENPDDADFSWAGPEGDIDSNGQTITVDQSGVYTVTVDIGGCTGTESVNIEFTDLPDFDLGDDITTCSLQEITLDATPTNTDVEDTQFEWDYNGEPIDEMGPTVNPADYGYGTYSVNVYTDNVDCAAQDTVQIDEIDDFGVQLEADNDLSQTLKRCENDDTGSSYEITFTASVTTDTGGEEVEFSWYKNDELIEGETTATYTLSYDSEGVYDDEITVHAQLGGCETEASLNTDVELTTYDHPCKISEGLSPGNNDGKNDKLDLTFLNDRSGIAKFEVFNRYGNKVYEKSNYTDSWHGQDDHGDDLVTGTYYYIIKLKNEDAVFGYTKRGWIYVNQKVN